MSNEQVIKLSKQEYPEDDTCFALLVDVARACHEQYTKEGHSSRSILFGLADYLQDFDAEARLKTFEHPCLASLPKTKES